MKLTAKQWQVLFCFVLFLCLFAAGGMRHRRRRVGRLVSTPSAGRWPLSTGEGGGTSTWRYWKRATDGASIGPLQSPTRKVVALQLQRSAVGSNSFRSTHPSMAVGKECGCELISTTTIGCWYLTISRGYVTVGRRLRQLLNAKRPSRWFFILLRQLLMLFWDVLIDRQVGPRFGWLTSSSYKPSVWA